MYKAQLTIKEGDLKYFYKWILRYTKKKTYTKIAIIPQSNYFVHIFT